MGLVLLVQGVAVSAAIPAAISESTSPAITMDADMPCHGQAEDAAGQDNSSCCDADCPDMTSCMLGQLAINANFQLTTLHVPDQVPQLKSLRFINRASPTHLRPPISLHG